MSSKDDFNSFNGMATPDGKFVAFDSFADNFVAGDTDPGIDGNKDVFVKNMTTGEIVLVSGTVDGGHTVFGNGNSDGGVISDDGRFVYFESDADNLVSGDNNGATDAFIKDLLTGRIELISKSSSGPGSANGLSLSMTMTPDAKYAVFYTEATDIVPVSSDHPFGPGDIIWKNRITGDTKLVSAAADGTPGNDFSGNAVISADGRYVAFDSSASNLVAGDTKDNNDVFVKDMLTGAIVMVSVNAQGVQGDQFGIHPVISADGKYIAFQGDSTNLVPNDTNNQRDVFRAFNPLYNFDPVIKSNGGGVTADVAVAENTTGVTTVIATDQNINQALTYSIVGGVDGSLFKIESGVLAFITSPDFEHPNDANHDGIYEVLVGVSDGDFGQDTQLIKVKVTDVNEPPVITSGGGGDRADYVIGEDAFEHGRRGVTTIQATDPDKGDARSYSIVAGTGLDMAGHAIFSIDKTTGQLSFIKHPDEDKTYSLTVQVSDKQGLFDTQAITVHVDDGAFKGTANADTPDLAKDFNPGTGGPGTRHTLK